ncbi:MAG: peptidoglycan-binding protein [Merismopedia sp. SIO2A8]|nr:peptidoglycan-binding protein [Symploca sp. SIO2B6]NET49089.1 peptidoglycan-binding protein [Merismopedia sp. SIO2A8]
MVKRLPWLQMLATRAVQPIVCVGTTSIISSGLMGAIAAPRPPLANVYSESAHLTLNRVLGVEVGSEDFIPLAETIALADTVLAQRDRPLLQFGSEGEAVQAVQALLQLMGYYSGQIDGRYQESTVSAVSSFQQAAGLTPDGIVGPTTWTKLLPQPEEVGDMESTALSDDLSASSSREAGSDRPTGGSADAASDRPSNVGGGGDGLQRETPGTPEPGENADTAASEQDATDSSEASASPSSSANSSNEVTLPTLRRGMRGPAVVNLQERLRGLGMLEGVVDGVFGEQTESAVKAAQQSFNLNPDGVVGPATWAALLQ